MEYAVAQRRQGETEAVRRNRLPASCAASCMAENADDRVAKTAAVQTIIHGVGK